MRKTYRAKLHGDRIEWIGAAPENLGEAEIEVVVDQPVSDVEAAQRRAKASAAWEALAKLKPFAEIKDPVEWQREIRRDRPLPGRED